MVRLNSIKLNEDQVQADFDDEISALQAAKLDSSKISENSVKKTRSDVFSEVYRLISNKLATEAHPAVQECLDHSNDIEFDVKNDINGWPEIYKVIDDVETKIFP